MTVSSVVSSLFGCRCIMECLSLLCELGSGASECGRPSPEPYNLIMISD